MRVSALDKNVVKELALNYEKDSIIVVSSFFFKASGRNAFEINKKHYMNRYCINCNKEAVCTEPSATPLFGAHQLSPCFNEFPVSFTFGRDFVSVSVVFMLVLSVKFF